MENTLVTIAACPRQTRMLVTQGPDELLRAVLPGAPRIRHPQAVTTVLQGLSLWLDQRLCVVLSVDEPEGSLCLGLTDTLGFGHDTLHYQVREVARAHRRGRRLRGVGDFRQLYLLSRAAHRGPLL